ncbi:MAG: four-carbon acid sugar kinase family protein, partial [Acetobacteraceae bacterium]
WKPPVSLPWPAAIDAGTRELPEPEARSMIRRLAATLDGADPAFKKLDSLLRGHPVAEIAACVPSFDHCVIAPAFPAQGRVTRFGCQMVREPDGWRDTGIDLADGLRRYGVPVVPCRPGEAAPDGASLWDAETDDDLRTVVEAGQSLSGRVLWCGSGGLAGALAFHGPVPAPDLPGPLLALIGSDHPVSVAQLSAAWAHVHRITHGTAEEAAPIARRLARGNAAVAIVVPPLLDRRGAARHIERCFAALLTQLDPPGTLFVTGGETLRGVCDMLRAARLDVDGEVGPGVPTSILCGGPWDGLRIVSKSGGFGDSGLLLRLLASGHDGGLA